MKDRNTGRQRKLPPDEAAGSTLPTSKSKNTAARTKSGTTRSTVRSPAEAAKPARSTSGPPAEHHSRKPSKNKKAVARTAKRETVNSRVMEDADIGSCDRYVLIAEAAYFLAERRGFEPGAELQDWLDAEAEIDKMLQRPAGRPLVV